MKKDKRIIQAIVVIIIVGIGWVHNLDKNSFMYKQISPMTANWSNNIEKPDTLQANESSFYSFSRDIIKSGIDHLISNL
jgi:hypothetical protein